MNKLISCFFSNRLHILFCLLVFFIFNGCEQAQEIVPDGGIKEGVTLKISGGLAGLTNIIAIEETEEGIFLTKKKGVATNPDEPITSTWELTEEVYTQLWQTLGTNDVWNLQSNYEMRDTIADEFTYDVMVRQDSQAHVFSVYAPLALKERTDDTRYLNAIQAILTLAGEPKIEEKTEEPNTGEKIEDVDYIRFEETDISSQTKRIITIKKLESSITLIDETRDKAGTVTLAPKQISQETYDELFKILEENDVWSLKPNNEMEAVAPKASMYVIFFVSQNKAARGFNVYAPDVLKENTGDARYLNIVQAILALANN